MENTNDGQSPVEALEKEDKLEQLAERKSVPYLPNETWLQVIAWIKRMELAERVSLACHRFYEIAHVRLHERSSLFPPAGDNTRRMRALQIRNAVVEQSDAKGQLYEAEMIVMMGGNWKRIEWPNCQMPQNIVGMERIDICFFDAKVFEFFDRIRPLLANELHLGIGSMDQKDIIAMEHILPMCSGPILSITLPLTAFSEFSSKFPQHWSKCHRLGVDFRLNGIGMPKLIEWLAERRADGQPKLLGIFGLAKFVNEFISLIKQHFSSSHQSASFLVRLPLRNAVEFREFNWHTNEQLVLTKIDDYTVFISRGPFGDDLSQMREKLLKRNHKKEGVLGFFVNKIGNLEGIKKGLAEKNEQLTLDDDEME